MSLGFWVVVVVMGFFIGSIMGLKPKMSDVRLGKCRLFARTIQLHPKLIPTPAFINTPKKMTASYTVIDDTWRLPFAELIAKDGTWHSNTPHPLSSVKIEHELSKYFLGLTIKANSVSLFWQDDVYVKGYAVRDDNADIQIQQDLQTLKAYLIQIATSHKT